MPLKDRYRESFLIGAAVSRRVIERNKELLIREFNCLTCENAMKYGSLTSDGIHYHFEEADWIRDFARENGFKLRGHTAVWHYQTPEVIFQNTTREKLISTMKHHIDILAERYGKDVFCWDVVNEAVVCEPGTFYRKSPWHEIIGDDYLDIAFSYMKQILPEAQMCYNDYDEASEEKGQRMYDLVKGMKERGVPVDVVGFQSHYFADNPSLDQVRRAFERFAGLGVRLHVTELDVSVLDRNINEDNDVQPFILTPELQERQVRYFEGLFSIYQEYREILDCVTTWGVTDEYSWRDNRHTGAKTRPLLFDSNGQAKI